MRNRNYNNDFIDPTNIIVGEDKKNEQDNIQTPIEQKKSFWSRFKEFFGDGRTRFAIGMILMLISSYILIVMVSFFMSGGIDQSNIENSSPIELASTGEELSNIGAAFGARLSNDLIAKGIGLGAFVIVIWCGVLGLRIVRRKPLRLLGFTFISLIAMCTISITFGFIDLYSEITFFPLGGNFGKYVNIFLLNFIGVPGLAMLCLVLSMIWIMCCKNNILGVIGIIKKWFPQRDNIENEPEIEPLTVIVEEPEEQNSDTTELTDFDDFLEEKIQEQCEEDEHIDNDSCEIKVAPKIVMANGNVVEAYDPTKELEHFKFPSLELLRDISTKAISIDIDEQESNKERIKETLKNYGIPIKKIDVCVGPTITLFEIIPDDGVRISKIKNLEDDIALSLAALGIRIIAPIPGRGTIGIEVPNKDPQTVSMRSVIGSKKFQENKCELPMALGCTISNEVLVADLAKMPHLLVAGATGQGKSVGLNAIIASLLYKKHPSELKFVLVDPKQVEFSLYGVLEKHYLAKLPDEDKCIITDSAKVVATLNSVVTEMENRYLLLSEARVRNIKDYNKKFINRELNPEKGHHYMPYIVVIIDEFCDLIMEAGKEVERPIVRIAQKARAVGIHMIIATQRPSTNVITGLIKANFPGRIAFRVTQMVDSRTILDCSGAQQLVGKGDMLFSANGVMERIQCAFIDTPEVEKICDHISEQIGYSMAYELPPYVPEDNGDTEGGPSAVNLNDRDPLFNEAAEFIVAGETASTSSLQRRYGIGYNRAGRIMDQMEAAGIVGPSQGGKPRRVLVDSIQLNSIIGS